MTERGTHILYVALTLALAAGGYALLTVPTAAALAPHAKLVGLFFGADYIFDPRMGYTFPELRIAITQNCSGAKMYVSALFLLAFGFRRGIRRLFVYAACSLPGAVLVSVARIALSVPFLNFKSAALIHTLISLSVHFGALAALYAVLSINTNHKGGQPHGTPQ